MPETPAGLARALRVALTELLKDPPQPEMRVVRQRQSRWKTRAGLQQRAPDALPAASGETIELHESALLARHLHEAQARPAGSRLDLYVLQGKLITGPVERSTELGAGDCASFPADVAFVYEGRALPARALVITQRPG